jgi:adenine-specific DNA-methyltransferase
MTEDILTLVKNTLKRDERLISEDTLLKNKIMELTYKQDEDLIELLLSEAKVKEYFFTEVNSTLIFDKDKFVKFINNKEFLPDSYTTFKNKIGLID